jgi:YVTN family beta-propeller protein
MKIRSWNPVAIAALVCGCLAGVEAVAQNAYVTNSGGNTVSVIDTASNSVVGSPIAVGTAPGGVAAAPDGTKVYVTDGGSNTVAVIATGTNPPTVTTFTVAGSPGGAAVTPDGSTVYVATSDFSTTPASYTVSVIATATNTVTATIPVGSRAQ